LNDLRHGLPDPPDDLVIEVPAGFTLAIVAADWP
jgi:hypothetical protein